MPGFQHLCLLILGFGFSLLAPRSSNAQAVWVVDTNPGPGVHFTTIQAAVDAAATADVILVKSGTYADGFAILGKGLTVAFDVGANVTYTNSQTVTIKGLLASQAVVLKGLRPLTGTIHAILENNDGPVWFEDCTFAGEFALTPMISGVKATNCASVVFMSCSVSGIMHFGYPASHGVESVNSHILAYDSTFTGGDGYDAPFVDFGCVNGQPGGDGVSMSFGTLFASRCSFKGGSGGDELYSLVCQPGPGGNGLDLNSMALIELQNCSYVAGPAGAGSPPQPPSPPLKSDSPVVQFTGPKRLYQISSPVREQQVIQLEFQLDVPSEVYLLASPDPGVDVFFGGLTGPLALDAFAMGFVSLGMLPAGTTVLSVPAGNLPPTLPGSFLSTQPLFTDSSWSYFELGSPSHLVLLDGSL